MNANELRRAVEGADGTRGEDVHFTVENERLKRVPSPTEPGTFIVVRTDLKGDGGLNGSARLKVVPGTDTEIPEKADAVFTSQSAFEKFVLPYYVRTRSIEELQDLVGRFYKRTVKCAFHLPSSEIDEPDLFLLHQNGTVTPIDRP
jgi:hypothetical protein